MSLEIEINRHKECVTNLSKQMEVVTKIQYHEKLINKKKETPDFPTVQYFKLSELENKLNAFKDTLHRYKIEYKKLNNGEFN